jgi:hypothetical protein
MRSKKQRDLDRARAKNNASEYHWKQMTAAEKEWLIAFETSEYEAERGHISEAVDVLLEVGVVPSDSYVEGMRARHVAARNDNPKRSDAKIKADRKYDNYQGIRKPKSNMYDSSDYVRVMRGPVDEDALGIEPAYNKEEVYDQAFGPILKETNPDNVAVMVNPEDGMIDAIGLAKSKGRSLEKLIEDAKLSKEAQELLLAKAQKLTYSAMVYTFHGRQYMNLNYIRIAPDGSEWVVDQHKRLVRLSLYLKRETSDSFATHCEIWRPGASKPEVWVFQAGHRSDVEGKAVCYASL